MHATKKGFLPYRCHPGRIASRLLVFFALFTTAAGVQGQDFYAELFRLDVKNNHRSLIAQHMQFTQTEGTAFWSIYDQYQEEVDVMLAERKAVILDFADNYEALSDDKANELAEILFTWEIKRTKLKRKYFRKFDTVMRTTTTAKFFQFEGQLNRIMDLQVFSVIPMIR